MSRTEALEQYNYANKQGQKYYKAAISSGKDPYPVVLDDIINENRVSERVELGLINIPSDLIVGTKSIGRTFALAGNFMPLLDASSEFGLKWISLCDDHLGEEGIREPIKCFEYLGKFYIQEGNKRASVLLSFDAPSVPAVVTRLIPEYSDDPDVQIYYEFLHFYSLSDLYDITFTHPGRYKKLLAALGMEDDHSWTEWERRSFSAGYSHFLEAYNSLNLKNSEVTPAEALLTWLEVFPFSDIKELSATELAKKLSALRGDFSVSDDARSINVSTEPGSTEKGVISKLLSFAHSEHINAAFIYGYSPDKSSWTQAHELGRQYIEKKLDGRVSTRVYTAYSKNYCEEMEAAIADGAQVIFATTPAMIGACRKIAALHTDIKVLNCALSVPYTNVRTYYSRIYECKFIAGAIAGAMAENGLIGYIANYPIFGVPAGINAFALGARMTNPRARIVLTWSCVSEDPLGELTERGISVISNRDAAKPDFNHRALEWGTYKLLDNNELQPLAIPCWDWGHFYEKIILSIFSGSYNSLSAPKAINYWWGLNSRVVDIKLSDTLPEGVRTLAALLKHGIASGSIDPFKTYIEDSSGQIRNDGSRTFSAEEIMTMDWLCENIEGSIPPFNVILPMAQDTVRLLGIYRDLIAPETEEKQL